ncbi:MAG: hypothetical protein QOI94_2131 [Acidobacteriaceae bacterium]|nr:hypothetical protein [Acidobacteriaceae bacterium]
MVMLRRLGKANAIPQAAVSGSGRILDLGSSPLPVQQKRSMGLRPSFSAHVRRREHGAPVQGGGLRFFAPTATYSGEEIPSSGSFRTGTVYDSGN